jgi:hypothetical protein
MPFVQPERPSFSTTSVVAAIRDAVLASRRERIAAVFVDVIVIVVAVVVMIFIVMLMMSTSMTQRSDARCKPSSTTCHARRMPSSMT